MNTSQRFGGIIWTNHALERLHQRNLPQNLAFSAFSTPDRRIDGKKSGTFEFQRRIDGYFVTLIATQNEKKEWVVLSCWVDPPMPGSIDIEKQRRYREYQKASFWRKLWLTFKTQIGL